MIIEATLFSFVFSICVVSGFRQAAKPELRLQSRMFVRGIRMLAVKKQNMNNK